MSHLEAIKALVRGSHSALLPLSVRSEGEHATGGAQQLVS